MKQPFPVNPDSASTFLANNTSTKQTYFYKDLYFPPCVVLGGYDPIVLPETSTFSSHFNLALWLQVHTQIERQS